MSILRQILSFDRYDPSRDTLVFSCASRVLNQGANRGLIGAPFYLVWRLPPLQGWGIKARTLNGSHCGAQGLNPLLSTLPLGLSG